MVPPLVTVVLPPPVSPLLFIVPACCSPIGVQKQASPANDNATPIADHRHSQIIPARLSAKWSKGTLGAEDEHLPGARLCQVVPVKMASVRRGDGHGRGADEVECARTLGTRLSGRFAGGQIWLADPPWPTAGRDGQCRESYPTRSWLISNE